MISFSVALDPNNGIGINGTLPWHIKEELQKFKANTLNKHIIMGRTTYEKLPKKLENRIVMVVTKDKNYHQEDVEVINDFDSFLKQHQDDETEYVICGGASIYRQAYPYTKKAYVSFIKNTYEVDTKLDCLNLNDWNVTLQEDHEQFIYKELIRK